MAMTIRLFLAGWLLAWASPAAAQVDERKLLDLTYSFDERTVYWPTNKPFQWEKTAWGIPAGGDWAPSANLASAGPVGRLTSRPVPFGKARSTEQRVPAHRL